jgi:Ca2+-binding EF-hand superfamily protein
MNARSWCAVGLAAVLGVAPAPAAEKAPAGVQDFVLLTEARPVLVRMHVRVDGRPVEAAWDDFTKYLFGYLDVDGDGRLSKDEAERAPSVSQILSGGPIPGGPFVMGRQQPAPTPGALDADKDGKVTPAELSACYRKLGLTPFQFQLGAPAANPLGAAAAFLGGPRPDPPVSAVSEAAFALLDADRDGKLSKDELAAAPAALLRLDEDGDDVVTAAEMVPNAQANPLDLAQMMGGGNRPGAGGGNRTLVPVTTPGEAPPELVRLLRERYGPKTDKPEEKKLSRKDLGLDEATFGRLDASGDGVLDAAELAGFVKRAPDLELTVRVGRRGPAESPVEVAARGEGASPLAGKVRARDGVALLDLGATRVDLRAGEGAGADRFGGLLQQQYLLQLRQADKDGNGVIDEAEGQANRNFRALFKTVDRDGDRKVTEKELSGYLDQARELQARATAGCVSLSLTDQSRGVFDLLDDTRDGRLSVREARQAPKLLGRDGPGALRREDVPRSYRLLVRRGAADGGLNPGALVELYYGGSRAEAEPEGTAGSLWFRKMDRNRDGDVSRKEFLFSAEAFRRLDADGDGLISAAEAEKARAPGGSGK